MTDSTKDRDALEELLYLESDGFLGEEDKSRLDEACRDNADLAHEREELRLLATKLEESRIEVREGFREELMESLPAVGWSSRHPRTWWLAASVLALLGGAAAMLTGLSAARLEPSSPFVGAMRAVADMMAASLAAGAGLVGASWQGLAMALEEWIGLSAPNAIAFGVLVVGVNWMVWRSLRRRERAVEAPTAGRVQNRVGHDKSGGETDRHETD